jgi:hypothetical protein
VTDDAVEEPDETIDLQLSDPANATLGALSNTTYTINDDDAGGFTDLDGDGMDDNWEIKWYGGTNITDNGAANGDGDEFTDAEESIAGTDPTDGNSRFAADNVGMSLTDYTISLQTYSGRTYTVQYVLDMLDTNWLFLATFPGDGSATNWTDPNATNDIKHYRMQVTY